MTIPLAVLAAKPVPAYCTSGHGVLSAAQWKTCWDAGWAQPVNTTVAHAGSAAGTGAIPGLLILLAILVLIAASRRRAPAASKG